MNLRRWKAAADVVHDLENRGYNNYKCVKRYVKIRRSNLSLQIPQRDEDSVIQNKEDNKVKNYKLKLRMHKGLFQKAVHPTISFTTPMEKMWQWYVLH